MHFSLHKGPAKFKYVNRHKTEMANNKFAKYSIRGSIPSKEVGQIGRHYCP